MTLTAKINGQDAVIEIPDDALIQPLAVKRKVAAQMLGIGLSKLDILAGLKRIHKTSYGTLTVASLNAHLEAETKRKNK